MSTFSNELPSPVVSTSQPVSAPLEAFPFSALVGQQSLQHALLLAAVDPGIGGVLISGPRGTAKSTAARALAALLPPGAQGQPAPFVTLPLAASMEQLVGTLSVEHALREGRVCFSPGLLARAHGGVLYVDEVNLLHDSLVDALLDAAASGVHSIERDGISHRHAACFVLLGTMNPEEGELRPQLLDRFGLSVTLPNPADLEQRVAILRARLEFDERPLELVARHASDQARIAESIVLARRLLARIAWPESVVQHAATRALAAGVDGVRADLVMLRAARALAALGGGVEVMPEHVDAVAELALAHRRTQAQEGSAGAAAPQASSITGQAEPLGAAPAASWQPLPGSNADADANWGAQAPVPTAMARVMPAGGWPGKKA